MNQFKFPMSCILILIVFYQDGEGICTSLKFSASNDGKNKPYSDKSRDNVTYDSH